MPITPSNPDDEIIFPLSDQIDLVTTHHTDRSYKYGLIIRGLTKQALESVVLRIIKGETLTFPLSKSARRACLAVAESTDSERQPRPPSSIPVKKQKPPRQRKHRSNEDTQLSIDLLTALEDTIDGMGKSEILEVSGIDPGTWYAASRHLIEQGTWTQQGRMRGAKYFYQGN